jgi:hypothetical protein
VGVRERVERAIEGPVTDAAKLVDEAVHADDHTKLSLQLNGWFRGLAAGLQELAVELDVLREEAARRPDPPLEPSSRPEPASEDEPEEHDAADADTEALDEAGLAERARAARAETNELRD